MVSRSVPRYETDELTFEILGKIERMIYVVIGFLEKFVISLFTDCTGLRARITLI